MMVLAMFGFGVLMVGALWLYWESYTRPFRELQYAIAAEFDGSSPRVIGGREKGDEQKPETLRIVIRVDFDPNSDVDLSMQHATRLVELARQHHDLTEYEVLEVHLTHRVPEDATQLWSHSRRVDEWLGE